MSKKVSLSNRAF